MISIVRPTSIAHGLLLGLYLVSGPAAAVSDFQEVRLRFQTVDLNGNGQITPDEVEGYSRTRVSELDADGDGFISRDDYRRFAQRSQRYDYTPLQLTLVSGQFLGAYDANFDNRVSLDEYSEIARRSIFRWDLNKNRQVSFEEFLSQLGNTHAECFCFDR